MAKKRAAREWTQAEIERDIANRQADEKRQREKAARLVNAEKQRRFRESMKSEGFKQVLLWALPCPADVRERMTKAGFRQVPAWENEKQDHGQTKHKKWQGEPGRVKIAVSVRESSLGAADKAPEVRQALGVAAVEFKKALGTFPEAESLYNDVLELLGPLGNPWNGE
jgi:hypothetical protein